MGSLATEENVPNASIWFDHVSKDMYPEGFIKLGPEEVVVPTAFKKNFDTVKNFVSREDDVWVITHPKSGTTWTQEMVWLICNDCDFETALSKKLIDRSPFFEFGVFWPERANGLERIEKAASPRILKSHLHASLLPTDVLSSQEGGKGPKIIYTMRNPKSVCLSYFHHTKAFDAYTGSMEEFAESFMDGSVIWSPYAAHVKNYHKLQDNPNVLILTYEEMCADLPSTILRMATFLGKTLSAETVTKLASHLSFDEMKGNAAVVGGQVDRLNECEKIHGVKTGFQFLREGKADGFRREFSPELNQKFDEWTAVAEIPIYAKSQKRVPSQRA